MQVLQMYMPILILNRIMQALQTSQTVHSLYHLQQALTKYYGDDFCDINPKINTLKLGCIMNKYYDQLDHINYIERYYGNQDTVVLVITMLL